MAIGEPALKSGIWRRLFITIGVLLLYRLGCQIPLPGLDPQAISRFLGAPWMSLERLSIFALGVTPILSVLLIVEVVKLAFPALARWEAADERKAARLHRATQIAALVVAAFQGLGIAHALELAPGLVDDPDWTFQAGIVATFVAATALLGWLGERITLRGLGHGFWLLLVAPYLTKLPHAAAAIVELLRQGVVSQGDILVVIGCSLAAVALIVSLAMARGAPGRNSNISVAGEAAESGANEASLFDVWPPLLAKYVGGLLLGALILSLDKSMNTSFLAVGKPVHILVTAVLIAGFAIMRTGAAPGGATRPVGLTALAQIVICCGGEWLLTGLRLPFLLDGASLIVIVATALNVARSFMNLTNPSAPPYAAPPGQSAR